MHAARGVGIGMMQTLPSSFYDRDTTQVAKELLGCLLHRRVDGVHHVARVVETEAYVGPHDLACHASKGITPRTEVMYGPPGRAYVYFIYGLHWCLNAVTEREGHGSAVLFRALEPIAGFPEETRTDGPARLTRALQIDRALNRWDLTRGETLWLEPPERPRGTIAAGPRIGVDYAGTWAQAPLRFWIRDNPWVSGSARPPQRKVLQGAPARTKGKIEP